MVDSFNLDNRYYSYGMADETEKVRSFGYGGDC